MTEFLNTVYEAIEDAHADRPAATRRQLVGGAAGGAGLDGTARLGPGRRRPAPEVAERSRSAPS